MISIDLEEMNRFTEQSQSYQNALSNFSDFVAKEIPEDKWKELLDLACAVNIFSMCGGAEYVLQKEKAAAGATNTPSGKEKQSNLIVLKGKGNVK